MMKLYIGYLWYYCTIINIALTSADNAQTIQYRNLEELEIEARRFFDALEADMTDQCSNVHYKSWSFLTNTTEHNRKMQDEALKDYGVVKKQNWKKLKPWMDKIPRLSSNNLKRRFKKISILGVSALPEHELLNYHKTISSMTSIYGNAEVCDPENIASCHPKLSLEPHLTRILSESRNYNKLKYVWEHWREESGKKMRNLYRKYVDLYNKGARLNGFDNAADMLAAHYESDNFEEDVRELYEQLKPLYQQLHAYVRNKLRKFYGNAKISERGPIPAHLTGNMWAQSWSEVYDMLTPFPDKQNIDVTQTLKEQGFTGTGIYRMSDEFFTSLNLTAMPQEFWTKSIFEKPKDPNVNIVCHASAFDFCNKKDFRVKQCTDITMQDMIVAHHEMGHIQYFLQYKHQPLEFREGANNGFHEAVGDVIALSVSTPKHLHKIGLLPTLVNDYQLDINFLLRTALSKIAFLPFGYLMDSWRWDVLSGKVKPEDWNCHWWKLRYEFQGIKPPSTRTEDHFDPGAKYHIPANVGYVRYFVSFILQFQFHKALCMKAGEYDPNDPDKPMHRCDIYKSIEAGNAMAAMLKLGASKPWPDALEVLTGTRRMDATVLREYFKPLEEWLTKYNQEHQEYVGWEPDEDAPYCIKTSDENEISSLVKSTNGGGQLYVGGHRVVVIAVVLSYILRLL